MGNFFGSVWWLLVTLGILVTFHEFGHFWVARRFGVKVLRFSVGFGKALWSRTGRDGVEYTIGAIPLGGYVKFLDAREADSPASAANLPGEYSSKPPWQRIAIAAAGPVFNIVFTIAAFWAMFVVGRPDFPPVFDTPKGLAAEAGMHAGDRIVSVDGDKVYSFTIAINAIYQAAALHRDIAIDVANEQGQTRALTLPLSKLPPGAPDSAAAVDAIGLYPLAPPAVVGTLLKDKPAAIAGVQPGDRILRVNNIDVANFFELTTVLGEQAAKDPHVLLRIQRGQEQLNLQMTAEKTTQDGRSRWILGIGAQPVAKSAVERYGPIEAFSNALNETWKQSRDTLRLIKSMLIGEASIKNVSSVITIAQVANDSAQQGLAWFLWFLGVISLSLGILNLLPIPILDGGHIVTYLIEWIKGSPVSERTLIAGQYVGLALLVTLMSVVLYNDIARQIAS